MDGVGGEGPTPPPAFDANAIIDGALAAEDRNRSLLEQMLDSGAVVTDSMLDFLSDPGVPELLMSYLTRCDQQHEPRSPVSPHADSSLYPRFRDRTPGRPVMRAYALMELFTAKNTHFDRFVGGKIDTLLQALFRIFEHDAQGSFYHFKAVFRAMSEKFVNEVFAVIQQEHLLDAMMLYLHEAPVAEALIDYIAQPVRPNEQLRIFKYVASRKLLHQIPSLLAFTAVVAPDQAVDWDSVANFFGRLLDRLAPLPQAQPMLMALMSETTFVDVLVQVISSSPQPHGEDRRVACAHLLQRLLLKTEERIFRESLETFFKPVEVANSVACLQGALYSQVRAHFTALCNALVKCGSSTTCTVEGFERPVAVFPDFRIVLLDVIWNVVRTSPASLDEMPVPLWTTMVQWLFKHPFNNVYHAAFARIFSLAVDHHHEASLRALLSKGKLVTKLCRHYKDILQASVQTGLRAHVVFLLNKLRLKAKATPGGTYLHDFLASHQSLREITPELMSETQTHLQPSLPPPRSAVRIKPCVSPIVVEIAPAAAHIPGQDLGSCYAHLLGVVDEPPMVSRLEETSSSAKSRRRQKRKKRRRKKSNVDSEESDGAVMDDGSDDSVDDDGEGSDGDGDNDDDDEHNVIERDDVEGGGDASLEAQDMAAAPVAQQPPRTMADSATVMGSVTAQDTDTTVMVLSDQSPDYMDTATGETAVVEGTGAGEAREGCMEGGGPPL